MNLTKNKNEQKKIETWIKTVSNKLSSWPFSSVLDSHSFSIWIHERCKNHGEYKYIMYESNRGCIKKTFVDGLASHLMMILPVYIMLNLAGSAL